jgi:DNA-binding MarR family transcriptional regulator/GNAT superfamily N-acetyltransferase
MDSMPSSPSLSLSVTDSPVPALHVEAVRSFNRFYTQRIGVLAPYLGSELSLTEVRVMYEMAHREESTASQLRRDLGLDAGYLSRILRRFESRGWLLKSPSDVDARNSLLTLTDAGRATFEPLQQKSNEDAATLLGPLTGADRSSLVGAMTTVQRLLSADKTPVTRTVVLRDPQPGDMGWVVQQHGEIYAREYGWNSDFEAMVADIVSQYLKNFQPAFEKCWIAELDGERVGAAFVVRKSATVAQLRMLILAPQARGLGLGGRLTDECIAFARSRRYTSLELWTNNCLDAARSIYAKRGFSLVHSEAYEGFGHSLVGETWSLTL